MCDLAGLKQALRQMNPFRKAKTAFSHAYYTMHTVQLITVQRLEF